MKITHVPQKLFENSWKLETSISGDLRSAIQNKLPLTEGLAERLRHYPHILGPFVVRNLIPESIIDKIIDTPDRAFRLLMTDYENLKGKLEPKVEKNPETLERLIVTFIEAEQYGIKMFPLRESFEEYFTLATEDPNRYLRLVPNPDKIKDSLLKTASSKILQTPANAFFVLNQNNPESIPDELIQIIARDNEYAAHTLVDLGPLLNDQQRSDLENSLSEPKWIFHLLSQASKILHLEELEKRMMTNLPWTVEYLDTLIENNLSRAAMIREQLTEVAKSSGLVPELIDWQFQRFPKLMSGRKAS